MKREGYIKKLVSNSRAIISNQIGLPVGSIKMVGIIYWIEMEGPLQGIDLGIFKEYASMINPYLTGTDRLYSDREFLKKQDVRLDEITAKYKEIIIDKCFEIISNFSDK